MSTNVAFLLFLFIIIRREGFSSHHQYLTSNYSVSLSLFLSLSLPLFTPFPLPPLCNSFSPAPPLLSSPAPYCCFTWNRLNYCYCLPHRVGHSFIHSFIHSFTLHSTFYIHFDASPVRPRVSSSNCCIVFCLSSSY